MRGIKIIQKLFKRRIKQAAKSALEELSSKAHRFRKEASEEINRLSAEPGPKMVLGTTEWHQPIAVPLSKLSAHGLVLGASGAGKSYLALWLMSQFLGSRALTSTHPIAFGLLDAKGELFEKTTAYLYAHLAGLGQQELERIKQKIFIIDFSNESMVTPYNILAHQEYLTDEIMVANRIDTIGEQFSGLSELSVRMKMILKYLLLLLAEFDLPLPFLERLCNDQPLLSALAEKSKNIQVRDYFRGRFGDESKSTLLALRQRIDALLISEGVRLSLSSSSAPDFTALQDQGSIVLINTAGRTITRGVSELLQGLVLSDIKQSVFRRKNFNQPFIWFFDEAQNLYKSSANREHMVDLLTMSRSFGSFFVLLTQSLTSATRDQDILNSILGNVRWMVMLRSTLRDAALITPALPVTGTMMKSSPNPFKHPEHLSESEEVKARLNEVTRFPDRTALCWLRPYLTKAVKITTPHVPSPKGTGACAGSEAQVLSRPRSSGQGVSRQEIAKVLKAHERRIQVLLQPHREETPASVAEDEVSRSRSRRTLISALEEEYSKRGRKVEEK